MSSANYLSHSDYTTHTTTDPSSSSSSSSYSYSSPSRFRRLRSLLSNVLLPPPLLRLRGGSSSSSSTTTPSRPSTTTTPPSPASSPPPSSSTRTLNWAAFAGPASSPTRLRKRDLALGAVFSAFATVAAVSVPLGYGGVVNVLLLPTETPLGERKLALAKVSILLLRLCLRSP